MKQKKPFFDWVSSMFPDEEPMTKTEENSIYLIREMDTNKKVLNWIKKNFDTIFSNELNNWYMDESKWPQKRTFKMFSEWFDIEVTSMLLDLEEYEVTKE
ncbi:hypothetical protein KO493_02570 [Tamlana agarivorans]|uniref:Uncharacterized protein n=1 Tax=Pseudotamlana agarivorans TaxID=481183 RepID=A0ACC5U5I0_9FLAO|nr:hypothetical protein [Tamlana agarivorans]